MVLLMASIRSSFSSIRPNNHSMRSWSDISPLVSLVLVIEKTPLIRGEQIITGALYHHPTGD